MKRIICFDIETTGLEFARGDRIIEIGAVEVIDGIVTDNNFHEYVNPDGKIIPPDSYMVHKISNAFLEDKPKMATIAPKFLEFIGDSPIVAHNGFDTVFLPAWEEGIFPNERTIGEGAFLGSNLGNVRSSASLTDHVKVVANYAFMNTNIAYVPTGLTVVGDYAYARGAVAYNAENEPYSWPIGEVYRWTIVPDTQQTLTNVIIREVESVGKGAFAGTSLQSIVMGSKVEYLAATGQGENGDKRCTRGVEL